MKVFKFIVLPLDKRIEVVLLMAKLESVTFVRRDLQKQKWKQVPLSKELRHILLKFREPSSVCDTQKFGGHSLEQKKIDIIAGFYVQKP